LLLENTHDLSVASSALPVLVMCHAQCKPANLNSNFSFQINSLGCDLVKIESSTNPLEAHYTTNLAQLESNNVLQQLTVL
jgi:hypothetical protein